MTDEQVPQRIGDYEVLSVLGAGGMGKVYKVRNVFTERIEAMKIVLPDLAGQTEVVERFLREIKLLAKLNHPNIAALRTAQTVGNQFVMVMEFVEGIPLSARVAKGPIPPVEAITYIDQALAALSYAHEQHIVHRDIKPGNMMLTPEGVVKLMDFGIARSTEDRALTMAGSSVGSLSYMSPEQIKGSDIDGRADLYSVGISLYEMVTGTKPFQADSTYQMMVAHLQNVPKPPTELQPGLPAALSQVILKALGKTPEERFQSADEFRKALKDVSASLGEGAAVPSPAALDVGSTSVLRESPILAAATGPVVTSTPIPRPRPAPSQPPAQPAVPPAAPPAAQGAAAIASGPPPQAAATPPAKPGWTPADSVLPPPGVETPRSYRGLYMTLGALIVVAVLVVAGIYGPRWARTRAGGSTAGNPQQSTQPASSAAQPSTASGSAAASSPAPTVGSTPAAGAAAGPAPGQAASDVSAGQAQPSNPASASAEPPNANPPTNRPPQTSAKKESARAGGGARRATDALSSAGAPAQQPQQPQPGSPPGSEASSQPQATQAANAAELDELENQMDKLSTRARAVHDSVENMRRQQAAQGLNLRGDISAAEDLMSTYLDRAKGALQSQNAKDARRYLDKAETQVETLEKFLGRR